MAEDKLLKAVKIFRSICPEGPESTKFLVADPDTLICNYEELCLQLMLLDGRLTVPLLQKAISKAYGRLTSGECKAFAQRIQAGLAHIIVKKKSCTSGRKLHPAVWRIISQLGAPSPPAAASSSSSRLPVARPSNDSQCSQAGAPSSSSSGLPDPLLNPKAILANAKEALSDFEADSSVVSVTSSAPQQEHQQYFDNASMCMVRLFPSGKRIESIMQPGETGFAVAIFPGETAEILTELPNSLLESFQESSGAKKKPSAKGTVKKRPAASSQSTPVSRARTTAAPVQGDPFKPSYDIMYYKEPKHSWAIRLRGGKQLFQITCQHRPKENLREMMVEAVKKLEAGQSTEEVKEWCRSQRERI